MIRKIITPTERTVTLTLPDEFIGKEIEVLAFALPEEAAPPFPGSRNEIEAIAAQFAPDYVWTYERLCEHFPSDSNIPVEIIYNQLFIMPSPTEFHQEVVGEICSRMKMYARQHTLGKVIISPFDIVWAGGDNVVIPDVIFVSVSRKHILDGKKATDSPDLVVEVWSPGNTAEKREEKRQLYEEKGVLEFWEVYPKEERVKVQALDQTTHTYQVLAEASGTGRVHSQVMPGFTLDVADLFAVNQDAG